MIVRQEGLPDLRHSHGLRINSNMDLDLEDKATTPQLDLRLHLLEAWLLFPLPVRLLNRPSTLTKLDHPLNRDILNKPCNSNSSSSNNLTNKIRLQVNRTTTMLQD
ncbi:hypothetical protein BG005_003118 [Podila minutissima]|nr:hypothetical protein BG005_003118 [Podila minutissima]